MQVKLPTFRGVNKTVDVAYVRILVAVRYDDEHMPYDFPFRKNDMWDITVNADTGQIENWPQGVSHELYMKVCDQGSYWLLDASRNIVGHIDEDYVPNGVVPGNYGDYIEMNINENGMITNWPKRFDLTAFFG